jgi:replicative DNA helicase
MTRMDKRKLIVGNFGNPSEMLTEALPHSEQSERAILGAIILDPNLLDKVRELGLEPYMMYIRAHQFILMAMYRMADEGQHVNPILLGERLRKEGHLEQAGGISAISELTYGLPHSTNVTAYYKVVKEKSDLRELIKICNMIVWACLAGEEEHAEIVAGAEAQVLEFAATALRAHKKSRPKELVHISEDKQEFRTNLEQLHKGQGTALPTGIKPLDDKLEGGGHNRQGFYVVAAEPKAGKTSFVLGMAQRTARMFAKQYRDTGAKQSVGIVSLEMRRVGLSARMFSAHTGIAYNKLTRPGFAGVDYRVAMASIDEFFDENPIWLSDSIFALPDLWRAVEKAKYGPANLGWLIFDYMQLAEVRRNAGLSVEHRTAEMTAVSRELKHMAQEFDIPLTAISSLSHAGNLRESFQITYDLEALIQLENPAWRPGMTEAERKVLDEMPVWDINARLKYQRNGPTGDIPLKFLRSYMQFLTPEEYEEMQRGPDEDVKEVDKFW